MRAGHGRGARRGGRRDQPGHPRRHAEGRGPAACCRRCWRRSARRRAPSRPTPAPPPGARGSGRARRGGGGPRGAEARPASRTRCSAAWKRSLADTDLEARLVDRRRAGRAEGRTRPPRRCGRSPATTRRAWCARARPRRCKARGQEAVWPGFEPASRTALDYRAGDGALRARGRAGALHAARDRAHPPRPDRDPPQHRGGAAHQRVLHGARAARASTTA